MLYIINLVTEIFTDFIKKVIASETCKFVVTLINKKYARNTR